MRRRLSESGGRRTTAGMAARLGGIGGILYVVLFIPAYIVGYPDAPNRASTDQGVFDYFAEGAGAFLFFNGVLTIFALFFLDSSSLGPHAHRLRRSFFRSPMT